MYARTRGRGFGPEVKRRIMLGTYVLSAGYYDAYYLKAQQVRTLILSDYDAAFERVDVVAMPTSPGAAFRLGERIDDPLQMYLADVFTVSANLAGLPAISVPCGFTADRLPIGLQLTGRRFDEATLLRARGRLRARGAVAHTGTSGQCLTRSGRPGRTRSCWTSGCAISASPLKAPSSNNGLPRSPPSSRRGG